MQTHEAFITAVAALAIARLPEAEHKAFAGLKLVYGAGQSGIRGVTYYSAWKGGDTSSVPFVELGAFSEESWVQLAGTTIHELAHVLAGPMAGHSLAWKEACGRLGLRAAKAAGHCYRLASFAPGLREAIAGLPKPDDGAPLPTLPAGLAGRLRACPAGIGTRGGKSRGKGSGSRLRLWVCECPVRVRVSSDAFAAHCDRCASAFKRGKDGQAREAGRWPSGQPCA